MNGPFAFRLLPFASLDTGHPQKVHVNFTQRKIPGANVGMRSRTFTSRIGGSVISRLTME
jgi:hypothetical protein